ncbi:MAG: RNA-binding protein [Chitinophagaceae bacterium]
MNIYIANLNSVIDNEALKQLFLPFGEVKSARIAKDVFTGESRGFGYVEMEDNEAAEKAMSTLNKTEVEAFIIDVREADREIQKGSYKVGSNNNVFRFKKN